MKLLFLRPMIYTADLQGTIDFYTKILGFTLRGQNEDWGWASLDKDDVAIMLARPNEHTPFESAQFTGSFYFTVDDVEAWWADLKTKARVCYEIETFEWEMREFAVFDNNGYLLQFGQPVE